MASNLESGQPFPQVLDELGFSMWIHVPSKKFEDLFLAYPELTTPSDEKSAIIVIAVSTFFTKLTASKDQVGGKSTLMPSGKEVGVAMDTGELDTSKAQVWTFFRQACRFRSSG